MKNSTFIQSKKIKAFLLLAFALFFSSQFVAQTDGDYQTNGTGAKNWNDPAHWQKRVAGVWQIPSPDYPGQNPIVGSGVVTILNNTQMSLSVTPVNSIGSLKIAKTNASATSLTFSGINTLTVTGSTDLTNTAGATQNSLLDVATGMLYTSDITLGNTANNGSDCNLTLSTGTIVVGNNITMNGTAVRNNFTFSGAGLVKVGGTITGLGAFTASTGTVEYNSSSAVVIGLYTYYNLTISNTGVKTNNATTVSNNLVLEAASTLSLTTGLTVSGTLLTNATSTLDLGAVALTVTGASTIGGLLTDFDDTGSSLFVGKVTVNALGTWNTNANVTVARVTFRGGFENNNPTANSVLIGACQFNTTASQSITGNGPINFVNALTIATGITVTNNITTNTVTVGGTFTGGNATSSIWVNANGSYLIIASASRPLATGFLDCSAASNTVKYTNATASVGNESYYDLIIDDNVSATLVGVTNVANSLLTNPSSTVTIGAGNFVVVGTTTVNGLFTDLDNSNDPVSNFTGKVTVTNSGTWETSLNTTLARGVVFNGGFENNNITVGSVIMGATSFNTSQSLTGDGPIDFNKTTSIATGITLTNLNTNTVTVTGTINGADATSVFLNGNGAYLLIPTTSEPMTSATLMASTLSNTVTYTAAGANVKETTYSNLIINTTTNATIASATTVNDFLYLTDGTFTVGANLTMANGATISRAIGSLSAAPSFGTNVNVIYTAGVAAGPEIPVATTVLNNLTLNTNGGDVSLGAATTATGSVTWLSNGLLILGSNDLTVGASATFVGNNSTRFIQTNGAGKLIKQGTTAANFQIVYPVGTTTDYSPMQITAVSSAAFGAPGNVSVKAVAARLPYGLPGTVNAITRYWSVASSFLVSSTDVNFTFVNPGDVVGTITAYQPCLGTGAATVAVTGPSATGSTPVFSSTGHTTLTGDWTYVDPTPRIPQTYYTYQSGNWGTPNVWTLDPSGTTLISPAVPGFNSALDNAVILNGRTVTNTVSVIVNTVDIRSGGVLDLTTTTGNTFGSLIGSGLLKLKTASLPGGLTDVSTFVSSTGGTIEYYDFGGAGANLSTSQTVYNNVIFSNSTGTNNTYIFQNNLLATAYTINGNISTSATSTGSVTIEFGNTATNVITMSIAGNLTNGLGCNFIVSNNSAIHTVSLVGNLINDGIIDWSNSAQWVSAATTGAVNLLFTGGSNKTMYCNGQTDIYQLTLNMGTDETYILDLDASAAANFKIFTNGQNITLTKGTLKLGAGISLVRLGVTGGGGAFYNIANGCKLWINGASVLTNAQDNGIQMSGGILLMSAGVANFSDLGISLNNSGQFIMTGGVITAEAFMNGRNGGGDGTFSMSGGTLTLTDALNANMDNDMPRFGCPDPNSNFTMSGGVINVYAPNNTTNIASGAVGIGTSLANSSVTGGTWNFYIPASAINFGISSNIPLYNVNIYKIGGGTSEAKLMNIGGALVIPKKPLVILNDFTIDGANSPIFNANGNDVTVGGNFNIVSGATYKPNGNTTTFNGASAQAFNINTQITTKTNLVVNKTGTLTIGGTNDFDCLGNLTLTQGVLDDGGKNLDVCGDITNSAAHVGTGSIRIQRGVNSSNVSAAGSYVLPLLDISGSPNVNAVTTHATFSLTITDDVITDISVVTGGFYTLAGGGGGQSRTDIIVAVTGGAGAGATIRCGFANGVVNNVWVVNGGTGYGPIPSTAGGGGAGFTVQSVVTGIASNLASNGVLSLVKVLSTGEGYTSDPTVTISGGGATAVTTLPINIGGSGTGVFDNLTQNNDIGTLFTANQTVNKDLRLAQGVMNIASYNLALSGISNVYDALAGTSTTFTNTKMIQTDGISSNGGVTKMYSPTMLTFGYPIGTGGLYTPANIALNSAPSTYGSITVRPVASEHPLVTASGQTISYYWKISNSGISLGGATVTHKYYYDESDVVANEVEYEPGRYNAATITWTSNTVPATGQAKVDETTNEITFDGPLFENDIDGDYTCGDKTPTDPFNTVLTFYSRQGGTFDWNDNNAWSIDGTSKHIGLAAAPGVTPTANSVVKIGDGATYNHTVTVDADTMVCGALFIESGSKLDIGQFTGHHFGNFINGTVGNGTLAISSGTLGIAEFPGGDFTPFLNATGGTVEYYCTGAQSFSVPAVSASTVNLTSYRNLIVTPTTGQTIFMPNTSLKVYEDVTVQGASASATVALNSVSAKTLTVSRNLLVNSGNLEFRNVFVQNVIVGSNLSVASGAIFNVLNSGSAIANTMTVTGTFTNNGTSNFVGGTDVCNVTFTNSANAMITGTNAAASTTFNKLTIDKGNSQTSIMEVDVLGTLTTPSTNWLTLTNGTFRFSKGSTLNVETSTILAYTINPTVCLHVNNAAAIVNVCYAAANVDLVLSGKIAVTTGSLYVGTIPSGNANDIIYSPTGSPEINVQGGYLAVKGKIRRSSTSAAGDLIYAQSGGTVYIEGRNSTAARGAIEVLNNGSFTMGPGAILTIQRRGTGATAPAYDLDIDPASSSVTGGKIIIGTGNINVNRNFSFHSTIALNDLTVTGFDVTNDIVNIDLVSPGLTLNGTLEISNAFSAFRANAFPVTFASSGSLLNLNTAATTGTNVGGYQPGSSIQITTFNSATASQTITGIAGNLTNFGNLVLANTSGSVTLGGAVSNIRVNNILTLSSGVFDVGVNTTTVVGNVSNSATQIGSGKVALAGSASQILTGDGNGVFQNLELNNAAGFVTNTNQTVNGVLTFSAGILDIDDDRLTLGVSSSIAGTTDNTRKIITNGAASDLGVLKHFPATPANFTFPMSGSSTKYTPAKYDITSNTAVGTIILRPVNTRHLSTQDPGSYELNYYWDVEPTGFSGLTATHTYTYMQGDVQGTETNYNTGRYYADDWVPVHGYSLTVNATDNVMTLSGVNFLDGDYTAGESDGVTRLEFDALKTYYSRNATLGGNWDNLASWSTDPVLKHAGATATVTAPNGNPIVIAAGHTITANGDIRVASTATISGLMDFADYVGHNFRRTSGTGTMKINATAGGSFIFPAGNHSAFAASGAGTFEFGGAVNGAILPTVTNFNNIVFSGTSTKTLAAVTYSINGDFTINGGTVSNTTNNSNVIVKGNWLNNNVIGSWLPGTSTATLGGTTTQTVGGTAGFNFYRLLANNTSTTGIVLSAPVTITNSLTLTNGVINTTATNILSITNTSSSSANAGSANSFVSGPMKWSMTTGASYIMPTGKVATAADPKKWAPVGLSSLSVPSIFTAEYYNHRYGDSTVLSPLERASKKEWWEISRSNAASAAVTLFWKDANWSGITDCSSLKVAHFDGTDWENIGNSSCGAGFITGPVQSSFSPETFATTAASPSVNPLPIELTSFTGKCDNQNVILNWSTASELNNDYFTIEKSNDGENWMDLTKIKGAGNSQRVVNYSITDSEKNNSFNYYRLKQTDFNKNFHYSDIIYVEGCIDKKLDLNIYPNPSTGNFNLDFIGEKEPVLSITVYNSLGEKVYQSNKEETSLDLNNKPNGVYFIYVNLNSKSFVKQIILQR